ncbi:MAG: protein kinase [Polyangiaceae bacterium]
MSTADSLPTTGKPVIDSERREQRADESRVGTRVGKYEIARVIGRGGMGSVYEALNTSIGKRVAMKFVDAEMSKNRDAVARFQREAQAASAAESAHIVEIFDSGFTDDGLPFIVMELLRGEDLGHRIKRCGRLELPEALHITAQILRGLHRAHEAGIVHRDLKPDNVFLVDRDDEPNFAKILDFGISKVQRSSEVPAHTLTRQGTVLGTPFYMSPEQAQALPDVDGRTDIWSVGAILYECLTGRAPHTGSTYEQVIINICMKDAEDVRVHNPAVPEPIAQVLKRALCRERDARFSTARELLDALVAAAPGMIGRSGRTSGPEDGALVSNPGISARTPVQVTPPDTQHASQGFGPTLEVPAGIGASRVGWSTNGGGGAARQSRRLYAAVAVGCLAVGGVAALLMFRGPSNPAGDVPVAAEVTTQVKSNAEGARVLVDGASVLDGVLRGQRGDRKRVRVEAEGYVPVEREVVIDPTTPQVDIALEKQGPEVTPAPSGVASAAPSAQASAGPTATPRPVGRPNGGKGPPKTEPSTTPVATPVATPKPTGVAGGLQIKTD